MSKENLAKKLEEATAINKSHKKAPSYLSIDQVGLPVLRNQHLGLQGRNDDFLSGVTIPRNMTISKKIKTSTHYIHVFVIATYERQEVTPAPFNRDGFPYFDMR